MLGHISAGSQWPAIRRINGEGAILFGGGRALLMQVAHPAVARGVLKHSRYGRDRIGRLLRTLRPMYAIAFGTEAQAASAASAVRRAHEAVRGAGYSASDPDLLAWILATLIDSALVTYEAFVAAPSRDLANSYYDEMLDVGALLGMPRTALPSSLEGFHRYVANAVATLEVSDDAGQIARSLFAPLPGSGPALLLARELTAGLLPVRLRHAYGLPWDPARATLFRTVMAISRVFLPALPRRLRQPPTFLLPPPAASVEAHLLSHAQ